MEKIYPDSEVELNPNMARHYDEILNIASLGIYNKFIHKAIQTINIKPADRILDLGAGTGKNALIMNQYLNNGEIVGLEISDQMISQFNNKFKSEPDIKVLNQRIDQPFQFEGKFDIVFMSFVLHGFPHEIRKNIINNAYQALKTNGRFIILDFNEIELEEEPFYFRIPFKLIECKYAFDFVNRNWKNILKSWGFNNFRENLFLKDYVRLLTARKGPSRQNKNL